MRTITLAVTHFNRFPMLIESFAKVLKDDRVNEILISDDASDTETFSKLLDYCKPIEKIKLYRNASNQGVYRNKYQSVLYSSNPWVIVFDSDNVIDKGYIDKLYEIEEWDPKVVYCPAFAKPKFDYRHFTKVPFITKRNAGKYFKERQFDCLINTMNCFVNREEYLKVYDPDVEPSAADSAYFNFRWLMADNVMCVVDGLEYEHRIHNGSHYIQNIASSNAFHSKMMNAFKYMK